MSTTPPKTTNGAQGFAVAGLVLLGLFLGGLLGFALAPHNADRQSPDPQRRTMAYLAYPFELIAQTGCTLLGGAIGGALGGVVGANLSRSAVQGPPSSSKSAGATPGETPPGERSVDAPLAPADEIPRIERAIARLQERLETLQADEPASPPSS